MKRLSNALLLPDEWPLQVRSSSQFALLAEAAKLSQHLEERIGGDAELDGELQRLFRRFRAIVTWIPKAPGGASPAYTREPWDMRKLVAMIPVGLQLEVEQESDPDGEGMIRWKCSLFDAANLFSVAHASDLEHNAALCYGSSHYGSAWTPNLALTRILIAAFILAAIQRIMAPGAAPRALARPQLAA